LSDAPLDKEELIKLCESHSLLPLLKNTPSRNVEKSFKNISTLCLKNALSSCGDNFVKS